MSLPPFQALLDAQRVDVYRFLVALVGADEAEDCFQETFLAALRAYPKLRDASNLRGWILTIAHRKAMDHHRSRARRAEPVGEIPDRAAGSAMADGEPELWRAVRALPPKQQAAVVARYVNDLPYRDIARMTGGSEEAARRNAADGVAKLREVWTR
ncbi:MAG: sigma-70 family RNA polymerase sigma factor [Actinobacteria bacterium]|nr:MAG: sigma-70 family RNA polymerase sigma factor [Actinomycetota bacterium]